MYCYEREGPLEETCQIWASRCTAKQKSASFGIKLIKIGQVVETRHRLKEIWVFKIPSFFNAPQP